MSKRNSPCACGSNLKFKKCCGKPVPKKPPEPPREQTPEEKANAEAFLATLGALSSLIKLPPLRGFR
jgi:hypothetical protein